MLIFLKADILGSQIYLGLVGAGGPLHCVGVCQYLYPFP